MFRRIWKSSRPTIFAAPARITSRTFSNSSRAWTSAATVFPTPSGARLQSAVQPRLLVLINGRQVYLDDYGRTAWQTLPVQIDEIRQIEVVKGPNSALFGFNAMGGVINIITFDPLADFDQYGNSSGWHAGLYQRLGGGDLA